MEAVAGKAAWRGRASYVGPVEGWKDWVFWSLDFSELAREGRYVLVVPGAVDVVAAPARLVL